MKRFIVICFCCLGFVFSGMGQGIEFYKGSFAEALRVAREQGKWVFVDVYGTVCPPCKQMDAEVFPDAKVGGFYNKHFVCLKVNGQTEEQELVEIFQVTGWPTYLFFDGYGNLKHRIRGFLPADKFIAEGQKALDADKLKPYDDWLKGFLERGSARGFLANYLTAMTKRGIDLAAAFSRYWQTRQLTIFANQGMERFMEEACASTLNTDKRVAELEKEMVKDDLFVAQRNYTGIIGTPDWRAHPEMELGDTLVKKILTIMQVQNVAQAREYALRVKSRELFDYALSLWDNLPESLRVGEREALELEFLQATGDAKEYVRQATRFLNRLAETVSRDSLLAKARQESNFAAWALKSEWQSRFEEMYCDLYFNYVDTIVRQCLKFVKNRKQLPDLSRWEEYAASLKPGSSRVA